MPCAEESLVREVPPALCALRSRLPPRIMDRCEPSFCESARRIGLDIGLDLEIWKADFILGVEYSSKAPSYGSSFSHETTI
jgi:hypothetical protein